MTKEILVICLVFLTTGLTLKEQSGLLVIALKASLEKQMFRLDLGKSTEISMYISKF